MTLVHVVAFTIARRYRLYQRTVGWEISLALTCIIDRFAPHVARTHISLSRAIYLLFCCRRALLSSICTVYSYEYEMIIPCLYTTSAIITSCTCCSNSPGACGNRFSPDEHLHEQRILSAQKCTWASVPHTNSVSIPSVNGHLETRSIDTWSGGLMSSHARLRDHTLILTVHELALPIYTCHTA